MNTLPARPAPRSTLRTDQGHGRGTSGRGAGRTIARRQPLCESEPAERPAQANGGRAAAAASNASAPAAPAVLRHLPPEAYGRGGAPGQTERGEWLRLRRPRGLADGRRQRGALPLLVLHLLRPASR